MFYFYNPSKKETSINNEELSQYPVSNESSPNNFASKFKTTTTNNESPNADITQYSIHDEGDSVLLEIGISSLKAYTAIYFIYVFIFSL